MRRENLIFIKINLFSETIKNRKAPPAAKTAPFQGGIVEYILYLFTFSFFQDDISGKDIPAMLPINSKFSTKILALATINFPL